MIAACHKRVPRCMPWPLAVVCWLDHHYGRHDRKLSWVCDAHDKIMLAWIHFFPASEARFMKRCLRCAQSSDTPPPAMKGK